MTRQRSFAKIEKQLLPKFRNNISTAESTEDVKKFFVYVMQDFFSQAFAGKLDLAYDDIKLQPDQTPPFILNEQVRSREDFASEWNASDLPRVMTSFAELSVNRYKHLAKNPQKTEAKIRM